MNNYIIIGVVMGIMAVDGDLASSVALGLVEGGDKAQQQVKHCLPRELIHSSLRYYGLCCWPPLCGPWLWYSGRWNCVLYLVIIAAIELNGLKGQQGPLTTVRGVIISSLVLTAVLAIALNVL